MKNLFFSLAFMLIGSFAFANNSNEISTINKKEVKASISYEIVKSKSVALGTCYITINGYDKKGDLVFSTVLAITDVESSQQCDQIAADISAALQ